MRANRRGREREREIFEKFDGAWRGTRKRRIRAGKHKIRRMELKGFERIAEVAHCLRRKSRLPTYILVFSRRVDFSRCPQRSREWIEKALFSLENRRKHPRKKRGGRAIDEMHFGATGREFTRARVNKRERYIPAK